MRLSAGWIRVMLLPILAGSAVAAGPMACVRSHLIGGSENVPLPILEKSILTFHFKSRV